MKAKLETYIVRDKTKLPGKTSFIVIVKNKTKKKKHGELPAITLVKEQPILGKQAKGIPTATGPINTLDDAISVLRDVVTQYEVDMGCTKTSKIRYNTITQKKYEALSKRGTLKQAQQTNKITSMMSKPNS